MISACTRTRHAMRGHAPAMRGVRPRSQGTLKRGTADSGLYEQWERARRQVSTDYDARARLVGWLSILSCQSRKSAHQRCERCTRRHWRDCRPTPRPRLLAHLRGRPQLVATAALAGSYTAQETRVSMRRRAAYSTHVWVVTAVKIDWRLCSRLRRAILLTVHGSAKSVLLVHEPVGGARQ